MCFRYSHFCSTVSLHADQCTEGQKRNKMWKSNIKSVKVKVNGAAKKMYVCTSCLRSGKVERA